MFHKKVPRWVPNSDLHMSAFPWGNGYTWEWSQRVLRILPIIQSTMKICIQGLRWIKFITVQLCQGQLEVTLAFWKLQMHVRDYNDSQDAWVVPPSCVERHLGFYPPLLCTISVKVSTLSCSKINPEIQKKLLNTSEYFSTTCVCYQGFT